MGTKIQFYLLNASSFGGAFFVLLFLTATGYLHSQNLIPNPGFENYDGLKVANWKQPIGEYYHFEVRVYKNKLRKEFRAINGLCIISPQHSEYMMVELNEPLIKDAVYTFQFDMMLDPKHINSQERAPHVHIVFADTPFDIRTRTQVFVEPDLQFPISQLKYDGRFKKFNAQYTARGGEKFVLIGNVFSPSKEQELKEVLYWKNSYDKANNIAHLVYRNQLMSIPPKEFAASAKKSRRMFAKRQKSLDKWLKHELDSIEKLYRPILDTLNVAIIVAFNTRVYFDNFYLAPAHFPVPEMVQPILDENDIPFKANTSYIFNHVLFDTDKSSLKSESFEELDQVAEILLTFPEYQIKITGHTDSINTEHYNMTLSINRAKSCVDYLLTKGVPKNQLEYEGKGENAPIASNETEEGRQMNRRVEFMFLKRE